MVKDESTRECKGGKMRLDAEYVIPVVMMMFFILVFVIVGLIIKSDTNKDMELCNDNNLEYLGRLYDENGNGDDYCGELKNGMLIKKYRIINSKYLEDVFDS